MSTIEHSAILEAPPERVFALLERVEDFVDYSDLIKPLSRWGKIAIGGTSRRWAWTGPSMW